MVNDNGRISINKKKERGQGQELFLRGVQIIPFDFSLESNTGKWSI